MNLQRMISWRGGEMDMCVYVCVLEEVSSLYYIHTILYLYIYMYVCVLQGA